ncbi:Beta-amylase 3, chloroplastic [Pelomyxa schiedti]|nr:Beta-amylase 3, chloroplastic [Pelomyxa schiedti]
MDKQALGKTAQGVATPTIPPSSDGAVFLRVMAPLDASVSADSADWTGASLKVLVDRLAASSPRAAALGLSLDVWWGDCERRPGEYDFSRVARAVRCAARGGAADVACIMSFHGCGMNVGDTVRVPLPTWLPPLSNAGFYFVDAWGTADPECLSISADNLQVPVEGTPAPLWKTGLKMYSDFMQAFRDAMIEEGLLGSVIKEVHVGLGPCGELRYPGYILDRWKYPGVGAFQAYDKVFLEKAAAASVKIPPREAFSSAASIESPYSFAPENVAFFCEGWNCPPGQTFLKYYSRQLIDHGDNVLQAAVRVFAGTNVKLCAKLSGIHWLKKTASHAAELTAGYTHGYQPFLAMMQKLGVGLIFTCFEKTTELEAGCQEARSDPDKLLSEIREAADSCGMKTFDAENALECYDQAAFDRIITNANHYKAGVFTFLRLTPKLFDTPPASDSSAASSWRIFWLCFCYFLGLVVVSQMDPIVTIVYILLGTLAVIYWLYSRRSTPRREPSALETFSIFATTITDVCSKNSSRH